MIFRGVFYSLSTLEEEWANRAWNDLEFFATMESKESASAHVQSKSDLGLLRKTMSDVLPLDMPESEWERRGMQKLGVVTPMMRTRMQNIPNITLLFTAS